MNGTDSKKSSKSIDKENPNQLIEEKILEIHEKNKDYGYRRMTRELRNQGCVVNKKKVQRIMHKLYLDPFMDMCSGEIISFGIDKHPSAINVMSALEKAIEVTSSCPYRRTFHSDQAWAYHMKK